MSAIPIMLGIMSTATEYAETLGSRIREKRTAAGLSLREFARRTDISPSYLSDIELGGSEPTASKIQRIAKELRVKIETLLPKQA